MNSVVLRAGSIPLIAGLCAVLLCATGLSPAQGTKADYERAEGLAARFGNKVYKGTVKPHWFADGTRFWYRNDLAGNRREFIVVDAVKGTRGRAFDHERLAAALAEATGGKVEADKLPVRELEFDEAGPLVRLSGAAGAWELNLESLELVAAAKAVAGEEPGVPRLERERPSLRTGEETYVTFVNRTAGKIEVYWVNSDGDRVGYGTILAGEQRRQHTFAGHVWVATDEAGKILAVFEAGEGDGEAVVGEKQPPLPSPSPPPERKRGSSDVGVDGVKGVSLDRGALRPTSPEAERKRGGSGGGVDGVKGVSLDGGALATKSAEPARKRGGSGDVSPDGRYEGFFRDHNLWVREKEAGEVHALSRDGSEREGYAGRIWWSPDSKWVVAMRTRKADERKVYYVESSPKDQVQPKLHSYDYLKPGDAVAVPKPQLFSVEERRRVEVSDELFGNPWSITELRWEADPMRFTFLYNQRGHQTMRVVGIDPAKGQARALVEESCATFFCYSSKLYLHRCKGSGELIWMSERDGWNHLYLYDALAGKVKNQVTRGDWVVRGVDKVDEEKRQIWFRAGGIRPGQDPYYVHYCRVNFDGTGLTILTEGDGTHAVEFSPDGRFLVDTWSRVDQPPVHELRSAEDGRLICEIDRAEATELLAAGWRAPERFMAKGRDGETDIYGIIVRPLTVETNRKYPVIEDIYAGPHSAFVPKSFQAYSKLQSLAELGFVVVKIDGMGTSHRSKKFHDVCWRNLGDSGFPDRMAWIRSAAAKYPYLDVTRVGIYGGSAGGQSSTRALLAHGDFYKVGVSDCGCHDNRMDKIWWNEQWMGWPVGLHYEEQSNVTQAHRLQGKLLLTVGEMDENVDPASTMQVVNALIKADKDFELVVFPGKGHGAGEIDYGRRRRADFFVRHLLGVEPRNAAAAQVSAN